MRSSNGGLAYGTSGNPQTHIMQETYAAKVAENEARVKAESSKPNPANVKIDTAGKLRGYALNPDHPTGKNKARVFKSALGFTQEDAENLERQIREQVKACEWKEADKSDFGMKYTVDVKVLGNNGKTATVRTGWIIGVDESDPRLTSAYVLIKKGGSNA
ncbi:DUF6883 domain-containing protein [Paratractidigestivibacter sp.]|uniref:DUF6883 domain-containing protein n=1 Tax=Paratractidigestivibacter sp. TaxID=2847316 RepID=UPI002ABE6777|nr:DUF6883 domain-containing protein [Paratractidigestivibacter sp.]